MLETKISYNLLYQDVLSKLKKYIKSNNLKVGDKLPPERELAVLFDISRGTLRQAFRILENSGIVIVKTGGGRFINRLPEDNSKLSKIIDNLLDTDILDVIEMRMALEKKSIELAIKNLTDKELDKVQQIIFQDSYDRNQTLFMEGDLGDAFYIILEGLVKVFRTDEQGKEKKIEMRILEKL